jgi:DNA-directed RNA polymerase subunit beta'
MLCNAPRKHVKIQLLSPAKILALSSGEVRNGNAVDIITHMPEPGGLFDCKIFGPVEDYSCICGEVRRDKSKKGYICPKCGVEIEASFVRRRRMGHITLAFPVAHIWYRSVIALLLNIPPKKLEDIIYCKKYIVLNSSTDSYQTNDIIDCSDYLLNKDRLKAMTGGDAVKTLLRQLDIEQIFHDLKNTPSSRRIARRLHIVRDFVTSDNKPEWMVMTVIPVLPPGLRPILFLDDGTVASSDLNDLYKRVIHRNTRLKRFIRLQAPEVVINNEKRLLQLAVDCLFDNGKKYTATNRTGKKPLKSLTALISTKHGRMRGNLLGKRVDYSGRSQIVGGPDLKLHQVGIPKVMALEMFKPFVFSRLKAKGYASSIQHAKVIVDKMLPEAIEALEEAIQEHPVILNRAPTLHKLSMQAFDPVLIEGKAIRLHPLVCSGFNADFDGDQIAVHVPLSYASQIEARLLMSSVNNLFHPATGKVAMSPSQDMVLGIFYLTSKRQNAAGGGMIFSDRDEVRSAYDNGIIEEHSAIKVRIDGELIETSTGRVLFSEILPDVFKFSEINKVFTKKDIGKLIEECYSRAGHRKTIELLDEIKKIGFHYATQSGISLCTDDMIVPDRKKDIIYSAELDIAEIKKAYRNGEMTETERYSRIKSVWEKATEEITNEVVTAVKNSESAMGNGFNSLNMMINSGARGDANQLRQACGMRGLMVRPTGEVVEVPITSSLVEGLTPHEYLLSTHGARKGRADGALKTANAGYFTARLVAAACDVIVTEKRCSCIDGLKMSALTEGGVVVETLKERITGRHASVSIVDPATGDVIASRDAEITEDIAETIVQAGIDEVIVRSPVTCRSPKGICSMCYGIDLQSKQLVEEGTSVGIIAAQSIGEPGTQLTLRTFHSGGAASGGGELSSVTAQIQGKVRFNNVRYVKGKNSAVIVNKNSSIIIQKHGKDVARYAIPYGATVYVEDGQQVEIGQMLAGWDPHSTPIISDMSGTVKFKNIIRGVSFKEDVDENTGLSRRVITASDVLPMVIVDGENCSREYYLSAGSHLMAQNGGIVDAGDALAKTPRDVSKNKDITSGLPRVIDIMEARRPKNPAILSEISGVVSMENIGQSIIVTVTAADGTEKKYTIKGTAFINVHNDDYVEAGDVIADGCIDPHDILRIKGYHASAILLLNEVQKVYRSQGVSINCKHFEVVISKMLEMVRIDDPGHTNYIVGDIMPRRDFLAANDTVIGDKAKAVFLLHGITKAALLSDSFLSSASFQRASSLLSSSAIKGKRDDLQSIKANVITGELIPVGAGYLQKKISGNIY